MNAPRGVIVRLVALWVFAVASACLAVGVEWRLAELTLQVMNVRGDQPLEPAAYESYGRISGALSPIIFASVVIAVVAVVSALGLHAVLWWRGGRPRDASRMPAGAAVPKPRA